MHERWRFRFTALLCLAGLVASRECPAPAPPIPDCTSGVAARLQLEYSLAVAGSIRSPVAGLFVQAYDAANRPLSDVAITLEAPASGPSGTFNTFTGPYSYVPAPNPLRVTTVTDAGCHGAPPLFIANGLVGSYAIRATTPGAPPLDIPATNLAPEMPTAFHSTLGSGQIAHTGQMHVPLEVITSGPSGRTTSGITVTFRTPSGGPSARFAGGATQAAVSTDVFGRAVSPPLVANNIVGAFTVEATIDGAPLAPLSIGPLVNGGPTTTTLQRDSVTPASTVFGQTVGFFASVAFAGYPGSGTYSGPFRHPNPGGTVDVVMDGQLAAPLGLGDLVFRLGACPTCAELVLTTGCSTNRLPFGTHTLHARYDGGGGYDPSTSATLQHTVLPGFSGATPTGSGTLLAGVTPGTTSGACTLASASIVDVSAVALPPAGVTFPHGLLRYRMDPCHPGATFGVPPAGWRAQPLLVLKAPASAPIAPSVFMVYGPTRDNPAPHWTTLPLIVARETIEVRLGDGDAGDDDLLINNVIVGVGGPAALGEVAIPGPGGSLVLLLSLALVGIPQRRLRPAHARRPAERQGRAPI